jgi:polyisoprenoid-binding protein YceI
MSSFEGFNSPLQQEHFNEHYLETEKYPNATFTGKIMLDEECTRDCVTSAVAKGKFEIHNVTQIVSLPLTFRIKDDVIYLTSNFRVLLSDYDIKIPRIVHAKISPEIDVNVEIELNQQK